MDATTRRARAVARALDRLYPDARCSLDFSTPLELLWATILSAQCTDARVNTVTPALFARYPDAASMAGADLGEVARLVEKTGFYRAKAKNLIACSARIVEEHGGEVPTGMDELVALAGVGRKTANVVRGVAFGIPGLPVDTHVRRLSRRMGLTESGDPAGIESQLCALLPRERWTMFGLRMIFHGRQVCQARRPKCDECPLADGLCPKLLLENQ
ncbi:MAG: endonuclease III [Gemmataceae bacterium]|nr:endonuclease III [Gemmataceae bacterium]